MLLPDGGLRLGLPRAHFRYSATKTRSASLAWFPCSIFLFRRGLILLSGMPQIPLILSFIICANYLFDIEASQHSSFISIFASMKRHECRNTIYLSRFRCKLAFDSNEHY